jgi:hypothetical protein
MGQLQLVCKYTNEVDRFTLSGRNTLVATPDSLQLTTLRPVSVDTWLQRVDAMDVQIKLDETRTGKIGKGAAGDAGAT